MSELLTSLTEVARQVFGAASSSVALLDDAAHELVFVAVCGPDAEDLVGARFKTKDGIAGQVAITGQALLVDDLDVEPRFALDIATETGYVPSRIMAAPLVDGDAVLGVLSVLDRDGSRSADEDLELLLGLARHAAIAARLQDTALRAVASADELGALLRP